ncbi:hypothetical protein ABIA26_001274 [Sinorhizobium fredii]
MCVHQTGPYFLASHTLAKALWLAVESQAQWLKVSGLTSLACRITAIALGFAGSFVGHDPCNAIGNFSLPGFGFFPRLDFGGRSRCCGFRQQALVFGCLQCFAFRPTDFACGRHRFAGGKPLLHLGISRLRGGGEFFQKLTLGLGRSSAAFGKAIGVEVSQ